MHCNEDSAPNVIQKSYLFQNFIGSDLTSIVELSTCKVYESGETIFDQGSLATSLFIISYGTVALEINPYEKFQSYPVILSTADTFGESHYHLREKHLGSARTREISEIYEISYDKLSEFLENNPTADLKFTKALAFHLGKYCHHLLEGMMGHRSRIYVNEGLSSFI